MGREADKLETIDLTQFIFFPLGIFIGLLLAWKWKLFGGIITILSLIAFHLTVEPEFVIFIELLAVPGLLFIISAIIRK